MKRVNAESTHENIYPQSPLSLLNLEKTFNSAHHLWIVRCVELMKRIYTRAASAAASATAPMLVLNMIGKSTSMNAMAIGLVSFRCLKPKCCSDSLCKLLNVCPQHWQLIHFKMGMLHGWTEQYIVLPATARVFNLRHNIFICCSLTYELLSFTDPFAMQVLLGIL